MKRVLAIIIALVAAAILFFYFQAQKPRENLSGKKADFSLSAEKLYSEFENDEDAANKKYLNKLIEVEGQIIATDINQIDEFVIMIYNGMTGGVSCNMAKSENSKKDQFKIDEKIKILGRCSGVTIDVTLEDCIVVE